MTSEKALKILLLLYVISTGFTEVLNLPWLRSKLQIPELLFFPLFFIWLITIGKKFLQNKILFTKLDVCLLILLTAYVISSIYTGEQKSFIEAAGVLYLFIVYWIFKSSLITIPNASSFIIHAFVTCGVIASISAITGWTLAQIGINNPLAWPTDRMYPYLGSISRAEGFTDTPNLLLNLLAVCFLIFFSTVLYNSTKITKDILILLLLILAIITTLSKSILLVIISSIYVLYKNGFMQTKGRKIIALSSCIFLFLVFIVGSHVLVINKSNGKLIMLRDHAYSLDHPQMIFKKYYLVLTSYSVIKKVTVAAGFENPVFGVGPGGFNTYVSKAKEEGKYPDYFPNYDPHSIYTGTFAELGIAGLLALMYLIYTLIQIIYRFHNQPSGKSKSLLIGITACFIFLALDGFVLDMLNFRHIWILFGLLASMHTENDSMGATNVGFRTVP